jgi:hypothetical protein
VSQLGTSTIASKADGAVKAYAILRFAGDELEPSEISDILGVGATLAYRKGETYLAGPHAGVITGRTGIWLLSTDAVVSGCDLDRHISYLFKLILEDDGDRSASLHQLIADRRLRAMSRVFGTARRAHTRQRSRQSRSMLLSGCRRTSKPILPPIERGGT